MTKVKMPKLLKLFFAIKTFNKMSHVQTDKVRTSSSDNYLTIRRKLKQMLFKSCCLALFRIQQQKKSRRNVVINTADKRLEV